MASESEHAFLCNTPLIVRIRPPRWLCPLRLLTIIFEKQFSTFFLTRLANEFFLFLLQKGFMSHINNINTCKSGQSFLLSLVLHCDVFDYSWTCQCVICMLFFFFLYAYFFKSVLSTREYSTLGGIIFFLTTANFS